MAVYDIQNVLLNQLFNANNVELNTAYSTNNEIVFSKSEPGPEPEPSFTQYDIYYPDEATNDYSYSNYDTFDMSPDLFRAMYYDPFVTSPPAGVTVTKTSIGKDQTNTYDVYEYDFCPTNYKRTILLSSGLHAYEISAQFGLAYFIKSIYDNANRDEGLDYLYNYVRIKVIPILNPWGAHQMPRKYGNVRGVNPNRNWDAFDQWQDYNPPYDEWNQKGSAPFSEQETVNIANWLMANHGAEFYIDCHTGEGNAQYSLWVNYGDDCKYYLNNAIPTALDRLKSWFVTKFGTTPTVNNQLYQHSIAYDSRASWMTYFAGIPNFTLEFSPKNTSFGTALSNSAADIKMYCANISAYVQELLLDKYVVTVTEIPIDSISISNITIPSNEVSADALLTMSPGNTTQNWFEWTSSDTSVVDVYGDTEYGELIKRGTGTTTITVTNKYDPTITTSFTVTIS